MPNAGVEVGEMTEVFGRLALRFDLSDNATLTIAADANDGEGGLRPYTTLIDELPASSALRQAGFTNADVSSDSYDNNTGQASQTIVKNSAEGISLTLDWEINDTFTNKIIYSQRSSDYKAGLDDDSLVDDFLSFPESGEADQTSFEVQLNGNFTGWDFVSGFYYFEEDGGNFQFPTTFNGGGGGLFVLDQDVTSIALYGNAGFDVSERLRVSAGLRYTEDEKDAVANVGIGPTPGSADFDEFTFDLSANYTFENGMNVYGAIQSGYQSGQFPARPFCLFGDPTCFVASDNITAINYEAGIKGQPFDNFQMSAAVFLTDYSDLPYQVSTTQGGGFNTVNLIVDQTSIGFEWENTYYFNENFLFNASLGYIDVDVDEQNGTKPVAPLTPELTFSISPELHVPMNGGAEVVARVDYSWRDDMFGEPSSDPGRLTRIDSRGIVNFDVSYRSADGIWTAGIYGRNATDERYDNARLNTGDYVLRILSNDASEFGLRMRMNFR